MVALSEFRFRPFGRGGGVNIGGGNFSFSGGGIKVGGNTLVLSGNFGGANVGGGRKTTGGPSGVDSGFGLKPITGCSPYNLAKVARSRLVGMTL